MSVSREFSSLLIGTRNKGKLREIKNILGEIPWRVYSLQEFEKVSVAPERGETYLENAIAKAKFYARESGLCALADDSGLEVEALVGAPGVHSARFAGAGASDSDRRKLLLSKLEKTAQENRRARFVCVVAIMTPARDVLNVSEGICTGTITFAPRGEGGFGYDPLFVPDGFEQTFAELAESIKNQISHRARALLKAKEFLMSKRALLFAPEGSGPA